MRVGLAFALLLLSAGCVVPDDQADYSPDSVSVFFCPEDACAQHLISEFDSAENSIHVAVYSFTSDKIANSLARAAARGVEVRIVSDYSQSFSEYSVLEQLSLAEADVCIKKGSGLMHNKFAVIDGKTVATGSFNYTKNADTKNDENLVLIRSKKQAQKFTLEFLETYSECLH